MTAPFRIVETTLDCPTCRRVHRVRGSVIQVLDEAGLVLWQRCKCGAKVPMGHHVQGRLFE